MTYRLLTLLFLAFGLSAPAFAQDDTLRLTISGANEGAVPVAVVPFALENAGLPPSVDIAQIIGADFNRSGQIRTLPRNDVVEFPARERDVNFGTWRLLRQDYLVVGRVSDAGGGAFRIEYEAFDVANQRMVDSGAFNGRESELRGIAHRIADAVYEKIFGIPGAFWTRIAYITAKGTGANIEYALMVADSDGYGPQLVVRSREPLMSPAWSPDGRRLAYVSFERGNSAIYIQELATGSREVVSASPGINGAPSFSPDGRRLAVSLSKSGNPEIYILDLGSRQTTQLTQHWSIDTEPQWMPNGQSIVFTSDRGGKPQLYQVPVGGGNATRLTSQGEYNAKPSIGYDGERFAMVQGAGNVYRIAVLDRTSGGGDYRLVSPGRMDESPSFAPNASMLIYASRESGRGVLYSVSADGRVRQRLVLADGDVREPAWSPYRQQ
jgi:TolB protein